ncbi:MAG: MlaD family protein [Campylobacterota bacterium]|nr:MlaD family protein [Campylobacterota bacterium]
MNNRVNYAFIGIFVLISSALILAFIYWLMKPSGEDVMHPYRIFFTESVSGLNIDSAVKFRGVSVGKVEDILINPKNSEEIQVDILLREGTPIKVDTIAKLEAHGITGLSYIDLSRGSKDADRLIDVKKDGTPVIVSIPSFFERMSHSMGTLTSRLAKTLERTEALLNEGNQERLALLLDNSAKAMAQMEKVFSDQAIDDLHQLLASSSSASQKIDTLLPKVDELIDNSVRVENVFDESIRSITKSYQGIAQSFAVFQQKNESGHYSVKDHVGPPMKQFELTMREMQEALANFNMMLEKYENSPSDMFFRHEEPHLGPGEQ